MQENSNNSSSKEKSKKEQSQKSLAKNKKASFFSEHKAEFKKITWPTKEVLFKHTITVIVISLIVSGIIFAYDFGIGLLINKLASL